MSLCSYNPTTTTTTITDIFGDTPALFFASASVAVVLLVAVVMLRSRASH